MRRADSVGTNSGFLKAYGSIDFRTINIMTAAPNPFSAAPANTSGGGMGLLPWYIHPPGADDSSTVDVSAMGNGTAAGDATAAALSVSASSLPASAGTATVALATGPTAVTAAQPVNAAAAGTDPVPATASG